MNRVYESYSRNKICSKIARHCYEVTCDTVGGASIAKGLRDASGELVCIIKGVFLGFLGTSGVVRQINGTGLIVY